MICYSWMHQRSVGDESKYSLKHLQLQVTRTRELVGDFKRIKSSAVPVLLHGVKVGIVDKFNNAGRRTDNNTKACY